MYSKSFLSKIYKTLFTIRAFETRCVQLYRQGLIRGYFHPYTGEEAIATGVCAALDENDYIISTHRGHGHCIARGAALDRMIAELLGKKTGYCQGLGGSMHIADRATNNLGANGIVGGGIPIGVGAALGISLRNEPQVVAIFFSDGAANNGVFAESLNLASIWNLPALFILENNHYAVSTPIEQTSRGADLYRRAEGYLVNSDSVDGNDVLKVYEKAKAAVKLCREGKGPALIECKTYRHGGHHVNDPGLYMPREKLDYYKTRDPVTLGRKFLLELGQVNETEIKAIEQAAEEAIEQAIEFAQSSPELTREEFNHLVETY